jgi:hypothetical protein
LNLSAVSGSTTISDPVDDPVDLGRIDNYFIRKIWYPIVAIRPAGRHQPISPFTTGKRMTQIHQLEIFSDYI